MSEKMTAVWGSKSQDGKQVRVLEEDCPWFVSPKPNAVWAVHSPEFKDCMCSKCPALLTTHPWSMTGTDTDDEVIVICTWPNVIKHRGSKRP